jgi:hypothetical protein
MLTVEASSVSVERRLAAGDLSCPAAGCGQVLARWGYARPRRLRGPGGRLVRLRPRRARCRGCGVTQVLLPVTALARRCDLAEVIGAALAAKAAGAGFRVAAAAVGCPAETVRGWLRRFAGRAELVRVFFTRLLADAGVDPAMPAGAGSLVAEAVSAIAGAAAAITSRWPHIGMVPPWPAASAATNGGLLSPSWPAGAANTS